MDPRHLALLRDLSARGTLAAVAAATHRTPSALSQQLRTAERDVGAALVEPHSRGLRLTDAGQALADSADEVFTALARARARVDEVMGQPSGTVAIGTLPSAGTALLPSLIRELAGSPIRLTFDDFDLAEADYAARAADVDIVIAHSLAADVPRGAERLSTRLLALEPIDVAVPIDHPLASREGLRAAELLGTTWIGVPPGYPFDTIMLTIEAELGSHLERGLRIRDNRLIESLVAAGYGLALLPRFTTPRHRAYRMLPLLDVPARRRIVALSRPDRAARSAVGTVLDTLADIGTRLDRSQ